MFDGVLLGSRSLARTANGGRLKTWTRTPGGFSKGSSHKHNPLKDFLKKKKKIFCVSMTLKGPNLQTEPPIPPLSLRPDF